MEKISVMVVDDTEQQGSRLEALVKEQKNMCLVGSTTDIKEALIVAKLQEPHVILIDIHREPFMAGIELIEKLCTLLPTTKIVVVSDQTEDYMIFSAFQAGVIDYLFKVCEDIEIIDSIQCAYHNCVPIRPVIAEKIRREFQRMKESEKSMLYVINTFSELTQSEMRILKLLKEGHTRGEIAQIRCVEEDTIRKQMNSILKKFNKKNYKEVLSLIECLGIFKMVP